MNDMPEFKQQLIDCLKGISDDKDFILSVGSYAGQNEEDVRNIIEYIDSSDTLAESDIIYALKLWSKKETSMIKVIHQNNIGNIAVLLLDGSLPKTCYKMYKINNREYNIVPVWDMKNTIAVETKENLVGKIVEFI